MTHFRRQIQKTDLIRIIFDWKMGDYKSNFREKLPTHQAKQEQCTWKGDQEAWAIQCPQRRHFQSQHSHFAALFQNREKILISKFLTFKFQNISLRRHIKQTIMLTSAVSFFSSCKKPSK